MEILYIIIGLVIGVLIGLAPKIFSKYDGSMIIDDTEENKTKWIIVYDGNPYDIYKRKSVNFKVRIKK